ncbi:MAG: AsmA family protein [Candidatus Sumerlaeota bacterium]
MPDTKVVAVPKPKSKILKWTRRLVLAFVLLIIIAVGIVRIMLPGIVKDQIEGNGSKLLKTEVTVGNVDVALLRGAVSVHDLKVKNYTGFTEADALEIKDAGVNIAVGSLMTDTIVIDKISVNGMQANAEVTNDGKKNLQIMMDNLNSALNAPKEEKPTEEKKPDAKKEKDSKAKGLLLRDLTLTKVAVNFQDEYSRDEVMRSATALSKFTVENVGLPADGNHAGSRIMKLYLQDYTINGNTGFTKQTFLTVPETSVEMDLGKLIDSKNDMFVDIKKIQHKGLDFVAEDSESKPNDDAMPENIRQFIQVLMNTLPGNEPRRYEVASNEKDSSDWYAVMTKEPEETAEKGSNSSKKEKSSSKKNKSSKSKDTSKADEVADAADAAPSPPEKPAEEKESPHLTTLHIDEISLESMRMEFIRPGERTAKDIILDDVNLKLSNIVQPYQEGTESELSLSFVPQKSPAQVTLTAKGALTDTRPDRNVVANVVINQYPLETVPNFRGGLLSSKTDMTMKDKRAFGTVAFTIRDLKFESIGDPYDRVMPLVALASRLQLPEVKVPYSVKVKSNRSWGSFFKDFLDQLVKGLPAGLNESVAMAGEALDAAAKSAMKAGAAASEQIGAAADAATETLDAAGAMAGETMKQGAKALGTTTEQGQKAVEGISEEGQKAVEGVTGSVKDTGKSITSGVKSLLGSKEPKDGDEKKPEEKLK